MLKIDRARQFASQQDIAAYIEILRMVGIQTGRRKGMIRSILDGFCMALAVTELITLRK